MGFFEIFFWIYASGYLAALIGTWFMEKNRWSLMGWLMALVVSMASWALVVTILFNVIGDWVEKIKDGRGKNNN